MKDEKGGKWDLSGITDAQRIGLSSHVELAGEALSFVYRMTHFIHHNPLHEFETMPFFEATRKAAPLFGNRTGFSQGEWLDLLGRGRLTRTDLETVLLRDDPAAGERIELVAGGDRHRLVDLMVLHMIHEWDRPGENDALIAEGKPAFLRLRRDLDPRIRERHEIRLAASGPGMPDPEAAYVRALWDESLRLAGKSLPEPEAPDGGEAEIPRPGRSLTLLDWVDAMDGGGWKEKVDHYLIKWFSAFLDEGVSAWNMPHRERGFYRAWRSMAVHDREIFLWGLSEAFEEIARLPDNPEDTLMGSLVALDLPRDCLTDYLERHAVSLPGWFGYIKWRSSRTDDPWQQTHPIDLVMGLSLRLFLEQAIVREFCRRSLGIPGTLPAILAWIDGHEEEMRTRAYVARYGLPSGWIPGLARFGGRLPPPGDPAWAGLSRMRREELRSRSPEAGRRSRAGRLFHVAQCLGLSPEEVASLGAPGFCALEERLDRMDRNRREEVWQRALEARLESELLEKVAPWKEKDPEVPSLSEGVRPQAQVLFCIDVRSERLRRHIESLGGYATYGLAGFFGIPFRFQPYQKPPGQVQAPVLLNPRHRVQEIPRAYEIERADLHFRRHQKTRSLIHLFHELKDHVITPYVLVEALGWFYLFPFLGKTFFPRGVDRLTGFLRSLFLPQIATALTVAKTSEAEALAMVESEQHARIRKACLTLLGPHTRSLSSETVEELRQKALEERRSLERLSPRALEELSVNLAQEADLLRKLRNLYLINTRRTRVLMETIMTTGFTPEEQAFYIENSLRMTGLIRNFSRLVLICGHGSESINNPYESALDCGACGGNRGIPNARVYVEMANNPAVRDLLRKRDIPIPYDTHFLAGEHNTTTDRIEFFDLEAVPLTHRRDLKRLWRDLEEAGQRTASERDRALPHVFGPAGSFSHAGLERRSCDYSEVRPEWGLSGNAWFIVGSRSLTGGQTDFAGRAFLHSYDHSIDTTGRDLESILTGPLVVGEWINAEHYFSALDPVVFGGGNKIYHNVAGHLGVMWGNESDLLVGLPVQTLRDGERLIHEPVRLTVLIEAPRSRISAIIEKNPVLRELFRNEWMLLIAADPSDRAFTRYRFPDRWESVDGPHR